MDWHQKAKKVAEMLLAAGILVFLGLIIDVNIFHFNYMMNADLASDAILAKLIWTSKEMIPHTWYIAAETRVICTPNFAALIYGLTGNMVLSEGLACSGMTILILASVFYFGKKAELERTEKMLMAFLGLALSANMAILELLYLFASYYAVHTAVLFFTLGIYVEGIRKRKVERVPAFFSMALALCLGIQGVRGILILYGPLFGIEGIRAFYCGICQIERKEEKEDWRVGIWVVSLLILSFIGTCFPFSTGQEFSRNIRNGFKKLFTVVLPNMWKAVSFDQVNVFGKICLVILLLAVLYLLADIVRCMWRRKRIEAVNWPFLVICASPVVTALIVSFTTFGDSERYYFLLIYGMAFASALMIRRIKSGWKAVGGILIAVFAIINIYTVYLPIVRSQGPADTEMAAVGKYLEDNDYHTAYASFENANTITVLTNGKVQAAAVASVEKMDICKWMSSTEWYVPNVPFEEKTAYIITEAETETFERFLKEHEDDMQYETTIGKYSIYVSDYNFSVLE